ncbi:bifunctional DNA primase/polymerase [Mycobacterium colombiense]
MSALHIPDIPEGTDILTAALAYAKAGWYIGHLERVEGKEGKNPGRLLGGGWQHKTSRDPQVITAWLAGTDHGIFLHVGRSGGVVFDVDHPDQFPEHLRHHLVTAPYQSSRPGEARRGHYIFANPPGRLIGNSAGRVDGAWGEVRGTNGVIVAAPTVHPEGGEYQWLRTGVVPLLPAEIADLLPDGSTAEAAAPDAVVAAFIAEHTTAENPGALNGLRSALQKNIEAGKSCHVSAVSTVVGAMKEARAGYFSAQHAIDTLKPIFINAVALGGSTGTVRTGAAAESEWNGILAWAVGQALSADLDEVKRRLAEKMPEGTTMEAPDSATQPAATTGPGTRRSIKLVRANDIRDAVPVYVYEHRGGGRVQLGTLALSGGRPGSGKSSHARWLTAGYSRGTIEGCWHGKPQTVAYVCSEESLEYTAKPGLRAADADLNRVVFVNVEQAGNEVSLHAVVDEAALTEALIDAGVTVVVVDPVMSTIAGKTDVNRNNEVREYLMPWTRIAQRIGGIVWGVVHLVKSPGADIVAAINGSSAFGEVARSVFAFAKDPDPDSEIRVMSQEKNSTGPEDLALQYAIRPVAVTTDSGETTNVGRFVILGESDRRAGDLLRDQADPAQNDAVEWLRTRLTDTNGDPVPSRDIKADARAQGFSERTLQRAASKLRILVTEEGFPRRTHWALPVAPPVAPETEFGATEPGESANWHNLPDRGAEAQSRQSRHPESVAPLVARLAPLGGDPPCRICSKPVKVGQGDAHLSCLGATA